MRYLSVNSCCYLTLSVFLLRINSAVAKRPIIIKRGRKYFFCILILRIYAYKHAVTNSTVQIIVISSPIYVDNLWCGQNDFSKCGLLNYSWSITTIKSAINIIILLLIMLKYCNRVVSQIKGTTALFVNKINFYMHTKKLEMRPIGF